MSAHSIHECLISKEFGFEAAHRLPNLPDEHKCARLHGHSFRFRVVLKGPVDPKTGFVRDYGEISEVVKPLVAAHLDHRYLNEVAGLENPTSEILARWLWEKLAPRLPLLHEITVFETCNTACHYFGDRND